MAGFDSPNYTQVPNSLFEIMHDMDKAELKVVMALVRETFGYHRTQKRMSIRRLAKATGLTPRNAYNGALEAVKRGLISMTQDGGVTLWSVIVTDTPAETVSPTNTPSDETVSPTDTPSKKEKNIKKKDAVKSTRPANRLFDVLAEVTHSDPKAAGGYIGKTASELKDYDPDLIMRLYSPGGWWYAVRCKDINPKPIPSLSAISKTIKIAVESNRPTVIKLAGVVNA